MVRRRPLLPTLGVAGPAGCLAGDSGPTTPAAPVTPVGNVAVTSLAFDHGETIPEWYTVDGDDVSPPLAVGTLPAEPATFALIVNDPDALASPFTHWLLWTLSADRTTIPE